MSSGWAVREERDRADADRHRELLAAARASFEDLGYGATTIAEITRRAGVSRATFYVYFASREDVFAVLADEVRDRFVQAQDLTGVDPDDVSTVLRRTIATTLDVTVDHLALMTVLNHQAMGDPEIRVLWSQIKHEAVRRTADYLARQSREGRIRPVADTEALATMGAGMNDRYAPLVVDHTITRTAAVDQMHQIWMACVEP
jgi:AcrR family transcriptional regulator